MSDTEKQRRCGPKARAFLNDVIEVCRKHNLSISHEDNEGAFIIKPFSEDLAEWLLWAFDETDEGK